MEQARKCRVTGWVRNNPDYSVEVLAEGGKASLETFLEWLHHGTPPARVENVAWSWIEPKGAYREFSVR
jgi:acylphosphatase